MLSTRVSPFTDGFESDEKSSVFFNIGIEYFVSDNFVLDVRERGSAIAPRITSSEWAVVFDADSTVISETSNISQRFPASEFCDVVLDSGYLFNTQSKREIVNERPQK